MSELKFETNPLFGQMLTYFIAQYKKRKKGKVINVGGSRSGKTIETANLLSYIADRYKIQKVKRTDGSYDNVLSEDGDENIIIDVYRNELKKVRKTYEDFLLALRMMGIISEVQCSSVNSDRPSIRFPNGNTINFYGLPEDGSPVEASKSHIVYFNEALEIPNQKIIANIVMRCEMLVIYDSNPSVTVHWLFDIGENDKDCLYTHTTYKDNRFLPKPLVDGLEEMCPWDLKDYQFNEKTNKWEWLNVEKERTTNIANIEKGTSDRRQWLIYGEGVRCARDGAAFDVNWINEFPEDIQFNTIIYGLDFGWTNDETALVRVGITNDSIYVKLLYYKQCPKSDLLFDEIKPILEQEEIYHGGIRPSLDIVCESQDNKNGDYFVSSLAYNKRKEHDNWHFFKVKKPKFRSYGVDLVGMYRLFVVRTKETEKEFMNFVYEERNGELTAILHGYNGRNNCDHAIDAMLYAVWEAKKHTLKK